MISGKAVPRYILTTYENIRKIYLHVIAVLHKRWYSPNFSLFLLKSCTQHRIFFLLFHNDNISSSSSSSDLLISE